MFRRNLFLLLFSMTLCASAFAGEPRSARPASTACTLAGGWELTVARSGSGTVSGPQISCGTACSGCYPPLTPIPLSATPSAGWFFSGWTGDCSGQTCTVTSVAPGADKSVTAVFTQLRYALTVNKVSSGSGTVTSDPAGISCGTTCTHNFNSGTVVTLTATPAAGSVFGGWNDACPGLGTCSVTMTAAKTVSATFVPGSLLTVTRTGAGSGAVTSAPSGINCGADCSQLFPTGTSVNLTATAASGSTFAGWSGACSGVGLCSVSMSAGKSVTAKFDLVTYPLTVNRAGNGSGVVISVPAGINCGAVCSQSFNSGTMVILAATALSGSVFAGWTGACSGSSSECSVTMNAAKSVSATFSAVAASYDLNVFRAGSGSGTVTSVPAGIQCGTTCVQAFNAGTAVMLTAAAAPGSIFSGWSGACSGSGACSLSMSGPKSVTALFDLSNSSCVPTSTTLCLSNNRFRVEVHWVDFSGNQGVGHVVQYGTADSGIFWFFDSSNWELMIKVLNACQPPHRRFWVFSAATTTVQYTLTVTDTLTGQVRQYTNPLGVSAAAITDTDAFSTCP